MQNLATAGLGVPQCGHTIVDNGGGGACAGGVGETCGVGVGCCGVGRVVGGGPCVCKTFTSGLITMAGCCGTVGWGGCLGFPCQNEPTSETIEAAHII